MEEKLFEQLEKLKSFQGAIIVEGKKDKIALEKLGLNNIYEINCPIYELCESIAENYTEVIILTDLDKEGKRLYSKIKENLERNGVKIDDSFRNFLFKETQLTQIEGLLNYIDKRFVL